MLIGHVMPSVNAVKEAVSTCATCTPSTLEALTLLLNSPIPPTGTLANSRNNVRDNRPPAAASKPARGPISAKKKTRTIGIETHSKPPVLTRLERLKLATEITNLVLKTLTDAIKVRSTRRNCGPEGGKNKGIQRPILTSSQPQPTTPLQPRSINRLSKSPTKSPIEIKSQPVENENLIALAECARTALAALRTKTTSKDDELRLPPLQVEAAMSALVSKLLALEMLDLAHKELYVLGRRLGMGSEEKALNQSKSRTQAASQDNNSDCLRVTLVNLLHVPQIPRDAQRLSLVVATQLHILKLLTLKPRAFDGMKLVEALSSDSQDSPQSLIRLTTDSQGQEKIARQLGTLAQAVQDLSKKHGNQNGIGGNPKCCASGCCFRLQVMSLQTFWNSWILSGHKVDLPKQVMVPLKKYLNCYIEDKRVVAETRFDLAESTLDKLYDMISVSRSLSLSERKEFDLLRLHLYQGIIEVGKDEKLSPGLCERIPYLVHQCLEIAERSDTSKAKQCSIRCRAALTVLSNSDISQEIRVELLSQATKLLKNSMDGSSEDLDDLFTSVSSLRKSAMLTIVKKNKSTPASGEPQGELWSVMKQFILDSLDFLIRYLGRDPVVHKGSARLRFEKRLSLASKVAPATISNIMSLAKTAVNEDANIWKLLDEALQKCLRLAKDLELDQYEDGDPMKAPFNIHSLISNIYWNRYLVLRQQNRCFQELENMLRKSITILSDRPVNEQSEAQLPFKLERLIGIYENSDEWSKAVELYTQTLDFLQDSGDLELATQKAGQQSLDQVFAETGPHKALARVLGGYSKAIVRKNGECSKIIIAQAKSQASACTQGFLLEAQLLFILKSSRRQRSLREIADNVKDLSQELFCIYNAIDFPIRRLRTLCLLLEFSTQDQSLVSCAPFHESLPEAFASVGNDAGLATFEGHYRAIFGILLAMLGDTPDTKLLSSSLDIWGGSVLASLESIQTQMGDIERMLRLLDTIEEFLGPLGLVTERIAALNLSINLLRKAHNTDNPQYLGKTSVVARQLISLGFTKEAGVILQKGKSVAESGQRLDASKLEWHTAYAEYFAAVGTPTKSSDHIQTAETLLKTITGSQTADPRRSPNYLLLLTNLLRISAKVALAQNDRQKALYYARRASSAMARAWALLERSEQASTLSFSERNVPDSSMGQSDLDIVNPSAGKSSTSNRLLPSRNFWKLVRPMIDGLLMLSSLLADDGLFLESQHYIEQAEKVAFNVKGSLLDAEIKIFQGDISSRSGQVEQGLELLDQADRILQEAYDSPNQSVILLLARSAATRAASASSRNAESLDVAYRALGTFSNSTFLPHEEDETAQHLVRRFESMSLTEMTAQQAKSRKAIRSRPKKESHLQVFQSPYGEVDDDAKQSILIRELRARLNRSKAWKLLQKKRVKQALSVLEGADLPPINSIDDIIQRLSKAHLLLNQAVDSLELDPVFNILSESTVALPTLVDQARARQGLSAKSVATSQILPKKRSKTVDSVKTSTKDLPPNQTKFSLHISAASDLLTPLPTIAQSVSSTATLHSMSDLRTKQLVLASAVCLDHEVSHVNSVAVAHALELSRSIAISREYSTINVEKQLSLESPWAMQIGDVENGTKVAKFELKDFQHDFLNAIPESWTAISLSLSHDCGELRLCRMEANVMPFVLCIPLNKQGPRDSEDEKFGYNEAKAELTKIIELANFSAHDTGNLSRKGAKTAWWEARAQLDSRLKDFLINIENIWLGGFRGVLKHCSFQVDLISRFNQSLIRILDKHLPSRFRRKASKGDRVVLDPRVLELFVALGDPRELDNPDDPILDLLYFIVDILHFNGERNAYDEIDFDPMVVEVQDALTHYHELASGDFDGIEGGHTILILDKKLHSFPWESLPCLAGQSISRLPSLKSLRDRILMLRQRDATSVASFSVDSTNGAYVLNPAGDLKNTQANLETPLASLEAWSSTVNEKPVESELAATLATKSVYLYFGHGSGGQYIRARTIRKLDQCAVALLMGCSSGLLTEAGEFESYGTPINYLQAGAPAVVGTLWDVTDKDIDRFSMKVLEKWGLFKTEEDSRSSTKTSRSASPAKKEAKGKGRQRSKTREMGRQDDMAQKVEKATLDRAVAEARDACILRYLNGAAPVIYGIPVSLS